MDALMLPLPKDWEAVKVEDIFEIITDFSAAGSFAQQSQMVQYTNDRTNYAQLIRTTELKNGFNNTNAIYINKEAFEFLWRVNLNSDAIILPNIGINCGEIYYVDIKKLIHKHNALAPNAILLRTKKANLKFLFYAFLDTWFQKQLINIITSSAQPKFTKTDLRDLLIPLPPLNEQSAIADILSALDRYLCALRALILKKESVKKALSFELLSQRKRLKGFNQAWQRVRLGTYKYRRGSFPQPYGNPQWYSDNGMPFVQVYDVGENFKLTQKTKQKISKIAQPMSVFVPKNSVIITLQGTIGRVALTQYDCYCDRTILIFDNNTLNDVNKYFFVLSLFTKFEEEKRKADGSIIKTITKQTLKDFEILLPSLNEQIAIANILSDLDHEIISLKNKKRQFENIKKALNHDLMSAKIRVLKK
ncbi:restriction endonuclease subunit S [Helicobacter pylori]|uniref:Restriction endonuclease subunit S n=1 Tax=Helicobacter pylori TaxID=210 RepID=A0A1Q9JAG9_HELPX|nr:restriction endonuclease subunit S [Helicobacter pylori]OLQ58481.1 restriction endonuclease subunit S [Helicobacter pylori]OLR47499.1 restriction endonuclease subunit S [Helicobacter pylori]